MLFDNENPANNLYAIYPITKAREQKTIAQVLPRCEIILLLITSSMQIGQFLSVQ